MFRGVRRALLAQRRFSSPAAGYVRKTAPSSGPNGSASTAAVKWRNLPAVRTRATTASSKPPQRVFTLVPASSQFPKAATWTQRSPHALVPALPPPAAGERLNADADAPQQFSVMLSEAQLAASFTTDNAADDASAAPQSAPGPAMTREQSLVCNLAWEGASLFIGGDAGTGKSFLLRAIAARMTAAGRRVAVTASTGIAALNIGGNTFHSTFGVPPPTPDDTLDRSSRTHASQQDGDGDDLEEADDAEDGDTGRATPEDDADDAEGNDGENDVSPLLKAEKAHRLRFTNTGVLADVDVVIIDEVSMLHAGVLESFDRAARRMPGRDAARPFGGLQMILSGDFLQLTPFAAGDAPFGSRRQREQLLEQRLADSRPGTQREKFGVGADRVVCERVGPENEDLEAPPTGDVSPPVAGTSATAVTPCQEVQRRHRRSRAALPTSDASSASSMSASSTSRHRRDLWYYDKPMFESWCFAHHLLHVQLREPQRQQDRIFAAALNRLRQGQLPYRISRSAVMNPAAKDAVRLLPTKAAVKNFNDRRLLQLDGEEHVFPTQLTTSELTSAPAPNVTKRDTVGVHGGGGDAWDATLLVYYQSSAPTRSPRATQAARGRLRVAEAVKVARSLEEVCLLPRGSVQVHSLPSPVSYSSSLCTVCVRCVGPNRRLAEERRATVRTVLDLWPGAKGSGNGAVQAPSGCPKPRPPPLAPFFPREVVRLEEVEGRQLLRRLQPFMQESLREAVRRDTVLQDTRLKVGCRVMVLRNLTHQYVNGSLGTVVAFRPAAECLHLVPGDLKAAATPPHFLSGAEARVTRRGGGGAGSSMTGPTLTVVEVPVVRMDVDGKEVAIPWITVSVPVAKQDWCFTLRAACLPLTPAYAFTVHKIQGVTLDHPVLFDADGMFPCDHLVYVAASRVRKFEHLRIINLTPRMITVHKPSLLFTQRIPGVEAAVRTWQQKRTPGAHLFYPSYVKGKG